MPGMSGEWASGPKGGPWDSTVSDRDLERAADVDPYTEPAFDPFSDDVETGHAAAKPKLLAIYASSIR